MKDYKRPSDSDLQGFALRDALGVLEATQQALRLSEDMGFQTAHAYAERKVAIAFHHGRSRSLYKWAGIVLAFRKASA